MPLGSQSLTIFLIKAISKNGSFNENKGNLNKRIQGFKGSRVRMVSKTNFEFRTRNVEL